MKIKSYNILFRLFSYLADKTNGTPFFVKYKLILGTLIIGVASSSANTLSKNKLVNDSIPFVPDHAETTCYKPAMPQPDSSKKIILKGKVQDEQGEWLPGVTLSIKGKQTPGTYTDVDGNFTLEVTKADIVVFTYVGFNSREIPASYIIQSNTPILMKESSDNDLTPLLNLHAQITCYKHDISSSLKTSLRGRVQDESGELVLGASVTIKGKQNSGTATDENGYFSLEAEMTDVIIFSFLGFDSLEVPASDLINSNKPIVMQESNTILCYDPIVIRHYRDDIYAHRTKKKTKMSYDKIPVQPISPEGDLQHFQEWMDKNIKYSETMLKTKVQGDVILSFIVDKEGKITNKKVISKLSPDADAEALRILSSSEKWTPGRYNNKEIKTTITVKVNFKMPD